MTKHSLLDDLISEKYFVHLNLEFILDISEHLSFMTKLLKVHLPLRCQLMVLARRFHIGCSKYLLFPAF